MFDKMPQHSRYSGFNFRYPPGYSLYQLLYIELRGKYSEGALFFAKYIMEMMLSISAFSGLKIKKKNRMVLYFGCDDDIIIALICDGKH